MKSVSGEPQKNQGATLHRNKIVVIVILLSLILNMAQQLFGEMCMQKELFDLRCLTLPKKAKAYRQWEKDAASEHTVIPCPHLMGSFTPCTSLDIHRSDRNGNISNWYVSSGRMVAVYTQTIGQNYQKPHRISIGANKLLLSTLKGETIVASIRHITPRHTAAFKQYAAPAGFAQKYPVPCPHQLTRSNGEHSLEGGTEKWWHAINILLADMTGYWITRLAIYVTGYYGCHTMQRWWVSELNWKICTE